MFSFTETFKMQQVKITTTIQNNAPW